MRKATLELSIITFMGTLGALLAGAAGDEDDDTLWMLAYLAARQENELKQFYNPAEAWRIIKNPIASIKQLETLTNVFDLMFSPFSWGDEYEGGDNAGQSKAKIKFQRVVMPTMFNFDAQRMYNFYDRD